MGRVLVEILRCCCFAYLLRNSSANLEGSVGLIAGCEKLDLVMTEVKRWIALLQCTMTDSQIQFQSKLVLECLQQYLKSWM